MKLLENSRARGFTQAFQYHCTEGEREKSVHFIADNFLEAIVLANVFSQTKKKSLPEEKMRSRKGPLCRLCVCEGSTSEARKHAAVCV